MLLVQPEQLAADIVARDRKSNNVADDPNPDLAIEIDISTSEIDRPGIYAALEVAEVWRFDGEALVIEQLQENGAFTQVESSRFLPIRPSEILGWLIDEDTSSKTRWVRRLRAWVGAELAGRGRE
jgi:Putative restriction endonuclease